jgi:hypothetical protein
MQTPQKPRPATACAACTMVLRETPSARRPVARAVLADAVRPAPPLRAEAGFLASFRVRHFAVLRGWSCLRPYYHTRSASARSFPSLKSKALGRVKGCACCFDGAPRSNSDRLRSRVSAFIKSHCRCHAISRALPVVAQFQHGQKRFDLVGRRGQQFPLPAFNAVLPEFPHFGVYAGQHKGVPHADNASKVIESLSGYVLVNDEKPEQRNPEDMHLSV